MTQEEALTILKAGRNVFLTGRAGSGKTYVLNQYVEYLHDRNIDMAVTASTGIAATHLGGVTIHSWSGIGIKDDLSDHDIDQLTQKESLYKKYKKNKVLIIDEISMLKPQMFDALNRLAKAMKGNDKPFGGMQVILSGDFFQLPPIVRYGEESQYVDASDAWQEMDLRVCYLEEQFRQTDDELSEILTEIRSGEISEKTHELLRKIQCQKKACKIPLTKLYTHNMDVDTVNEKKLCELKGPEKSFKIITHGRASAATALVKSMMAPENLRLKKEAVVMFVKNNFEAGYVNGTLGTVVGFEYGCPIVETFGGKIIQVQKEIWEILDEGKIIASAEQFPLRLAWAITIHKSQGMSLDAAEIDLSKSFVPGQGYVALSRLRSLDGLKLIGINDTALKVDPYVLGLDTWLKKESSKWSRVICRFSEDEVCDMHEEFADKNSDGEKKKGGKDGKVGVNGVNNSDGPGRSAGKSSNRGHVGQNAEKTHEITLKLLKQGMNLEQIAAERELKKETIINHLEKIKEFSHLPKTKFRSLCKSFKPVAKNLNEIKKIYKKNPDAGLMILYKKLGGKYSFEELKIARLFLD